MIDARQFVRKKLKGEELTESEVEALLADYVAGDVPDYVMSAYLAAVYLRGMEDEELVRWTRAMVQSGATLSFTADSKPLVDKHSTGGVGDKVSLVLAPALAACDMRVPMISGRGLGHTGGTLDKLEAIPGFSTRLSEAEIAKVVDEAGCVITGQTESLVPADRKLYALRDATGLVDSLPLIASSIVSKKVAESLDALVLDVKCGSGAFLGDPKEGEQLARTMIGLANRLGLRAVALQTAMDRPLGCAYGNALEVAECMDALTGGGPADLRKLVCALGGALLAAAGVTDDHAVGAERIAATLDDGRAHRRFLAMVEAQGGDAAVLQSGLERAPDVEEFRATASGTLAWADVSALGRAVMVLGGGRRVATDDVDFAVGIVARRSASEEYTAGDVLFEIHHRGGHGLEEARQLLTSALAPPDHAGSTPLEPLIRQHLTE